MFFLDFSTMPPVNSLSLLSNPLASNALPSHSLFARSLVPRSQPTRGFFGTLFYNISRLATMESPMRHIMSAWDIIGSMHDKNTKIAQLEIDKGYLNHHDEEWQDKNRLAVARMMKILAVEAPYLFVQGYVLDKEEGTQERRIMAGILKALNPEFYEQYQELLGEAMDWDEMGVSPKEEQAQDVADVDELEKDEQ